MRCSWNDCLECNYEELYEIYESTFIEIDRFDYSYVNKSIYKNKVDINKFPKVQANLKYQKGIKKYKR